MKLLIIALMTMLLLSGCDKARSNSSGLTVIEYQNLIEKKAADEMESGVAPTLNMMMNDYSVLRDQARVR